MWVLRILNRHIFSSIQSIWNEKHMLIWKGKRRGRMVRVSFSECVCTLKCCAIGMILIRICLVLSLKLSTVNSTVFCAGSIWCPTCRQTNIPVGGSGVASVRSEVSRFFWNAGHVTKAESIFFNSYWNDIPAHKSALLFACNYHTWEAFLALTLSAALYLLLCTINGFVESCILASTEFKSNVQTMNNVHTYNTGDAAVKKGHFERKVAWFPGKKCGVISSKCGCHWSILVWTSLIYACCATARFATVAIMLMTVAFWRDNVALQSRCWRTVKPPPFMLV